MMRWLVLVAFLALGCTDGGSPKFSERDCSLMIELARTQLTRCGGFDHPADVQLCIDQGNAMLDYAKGRGCTELASAD